ncbi:thioredoxin domain-containing protein [Candidatus Woesearchaeota archaeon]|nr:thioredoxin domain-containing protein [Candidatus Woesearchaeota archaeon]
MRVHWRTWSQQAFETAKKENKPILLNLFAVWRHWCHRMDADCYENDEIASIINSRTIPVRVDIDERPDIKERYHAGGFPTTAFLDAAGNKLLGGTYFPPHEMKVLINQIADNFHKIVEQKRKAVSEKTPVSPHSPQKAELDKQLVEAITQELITTADLFHGGWGGAPKFPPHAAINAACALFQKTADAKLRDAVVKTLNGLRGIYDPVEGGFFRYAINQDWSEPHYEKLLETNAGLLRNYLYGFVTTKDEEYRKITQGIISYLNKNLTGQELGGFFASQDADEEYYALDMNKRKACKAPATDKTVFVNLNAQAVSAYLDAAQILGDQAALAFALKTLDVLLGNYVSSQGVAHYRREENRKTQTVQGLFADVVFLATACLDAYEATFNAKYRTAALDLLKQFEHFYCTTEKLFRDRKTQDEDIGDLTKARFDFFENIAACDFLLRCCDHTENEALKERARTVLTALAPHAPPYHANGAGFAMAVERMLTGFVVHIVGARDTVRDSPLLQQLAQVVLPKSVVTLDIRDDVKLLQEKGYPLSEKPAAYVCYNGMCRPPASDIVRLQKILAGIIKQA